MITRTLPGFDSGKIIKTLTDFLAWWRAELESFLPPKVQALFNSGRTSLVVLYGPDRTVLEWMSSEGKVLRAKTVATQSLLEKKLALPEGMQATIDIVRVCVDPSLVFQLKTNLPDAPEGELKKIIDLQIERLFPLRKDHIYFASSKDKTAPSKLFILKRKTIAPVLETLKEIGIKAGNLQVVAGDAKNAPCFEIPSSHYRLSSLPFRRSVAISLAFWIIAAVSYWAYLDQVAENLEVDIAAIQNRVSGEMATMVAIQESIEAREVIAGTVREPSVLEILNILSEVLPAGAWVDDYVFKRGEIILSGYHEKPTDVASALEVSERFKEVVLTSVGGAGENSKFQIRIILKEEFGGGQ